MDVGKRLRLYQELEGIVVDDAPWIFLFNVDNYNFRQESLKGYKMRSIWPDRLENTWLDR